ncbi:MAG: DEAD/DEAH box helicase [Gammaproteobacteria bacterium]|nr:DEAD/DEAH box helicase [Gammaproteobacteria bacterium]
MTKITDRFLYDTVRLHTIASDDLVQQGLAFFTENRVFYLDLAGDSLIAEVEDGDRDEPYQIELFHDQQERLVVNCDCQESTSACKHAIAALYAYADDAETESDDKQLGNAIGDAIKDRVKRGRNEVRVKLINGNLGFGTWQATSIISSTHWQQTYQVQIRSLDQRLNFCTCPDLASNRLGTCKHIEAVLHYAKKQPEYKKLKQAGCPISFVYLAWDAAATPQLRLHRNDSVSEELEQLLSGYFADDNRFNGRIPDDFNRLTEQTLGRNDFLIGDDATRFVRQCAEDAAHSVRAQEIEQDILRLKGVLPGINATLFPYQTEGVAFLTARGRALLADDMGLGKTLQAICAASWLANHESVQRVLVLCPASLKHQWAREIQKFTNHTVQVIQGGPDKRGVQYRADALFFIINYELVLRDLSIISETLKPDLLILDEAQRIKNWRTKLASTVKLIYSRYVFVLSGTPLENRLEDLYSLLQVVDARVLGPLWRCLLDFHVTDDYGKVIGYRNLTELRQRIAPVMLRRNRTLVSDQLPDRTEVRLDIPMNDKQYELHDAALSAAGRLAATAKKRPLTPSEQNKMMAALQQARMACNAAGLVDKETQGSPKLDELERLLEELCLNTNRKAVVFSQWALMTEMVETRARSIGLGCVRLYGGIPTSRRGELMEKFHDDDSVQVFISTDAGGTGLNLQSATVLINLDMPWNPAVLDQRIARIHRLGQKEKVQVFLLLAADSYEQRVASLVQGKRDLFDNVVSPEASEDVVGVSKKMLESLIDDLAPDTDAAPHKDADIAPELTVPDKAGQDTEDVSVKQPDSQFNEEDVRIRQCIEDIQLAFRQRIERVLASGGGLLVVVDQIHVDDEQTAQDLSQEDIPVAVIDAQTLRSLQRLGKSSPLAETRTVFESIDDTQTVENPLLQSAGEKLKSAEILLQQQMTAGIMDLLASALLMLIAGLNDQKQAAKADEAAVWLYSEAVPNQVITEQQATTVLRILSLSQSTDVPDSLIEQALSDTRSMLAELTR